MAMSHPSEFPFSMTRRPLGEASSPDRCSLGSAGKAERFRGFVWESGHCTPDWGWTSCSRPRPTRSRRHSLSARYRTTWSVDFGRWPSCGWLALVNLDRLLLLIAASKRRRLAMVLQLAISALLGLLIAEPLTLRIFQLEVGTQAPLQCRWSTVPGRWSPDGRSARSLGKGGTIEHAS
jgi:hypothetical protein